MTRFICTCDGEYDQETVSALCDGLNIQPLAARALIRRGLTGLKEALAFLHPEDTPLVDPFSMPDMQLAVDRLHNAFLKQEHICIYGDYDADGICATAILLDCFSEFTDKAFAYIPSRHDEGYGLHESAVRKLYERGVKLIVTVDNGVSACEEIRLCGELGMDVIVTDHHSLPDRLPVCTAIVTPPDGACGAGVALRLARALAGDERLPHWLAPAAVATVADIVPLVGDNRVVVARGLPLVEDNMGLRALLRAAGGGENAVDAATLAFLIAPRLNAAGRLSDAMRGVDLLLARDMCTADLLAAELNETNTRRRTIESSMMVEAEAMLAEAGGSQKPAILLRHACWNVGVIGIVASRLSEKQHCPAILFSESEDGVLTGSGRSVGNIDLYKALSACSEHLSRFGGHAGAAGITMKNADFESFKTDFCAYLSSHYDSSAFVPTQYYDEAVALKELTLSAVSELKWLAPFGEGNPEPVYCLRNVHFTDLKRMGQGGRHISARAFENSVSLRVVAFGWGEHFDEFRSGKLWTLYARTAVHTYRGMESVELMMSGVQSEEKLFNDFFTNVLYNNVCVDNFDSLPICVENRDFFCDTAMRRIYRMLLSDLGAEGCSVESLVSCCGRAELCAFLVFWELGFFVREEDMVKPAESMEKRTLSESRLYRLLLSND